MPCMKPPDVKDIRIYHKVSLTFSGQFRKLVRCIDVGDNARIIHRNFDTARRIPADDSIEALVWRNRQNLPEQTGPKNRGMAAAAVENREHDSVRNKSLRQLIDRRHVHQGMIHEEKSKP